MNYPCDYPEFTCAMADKRQEVLWDTPCGPLRVTLERGVVREGQRYIVTFHDIGLAHGSCFDEFVEGARQRSARDRGGYVVDLFTFVHVDVPGQAVDAE
jgi:hypothetical protein